MNNNTHASERFNYSRDQELQRQREDSRDNRIEDNFSRNLKKIGRSY